MTDRKSKRAFGHGPRKVKPEIWQETIQVFKDLTNIELLKRCQKG